MPYLPPDVPGGIGNAESLYQSKYGNAPYDETRRKAQSRFSVANLIQGALSGLAAGPGGNFGYSLGRGFAASAARSGAARQAAQDYAEKLAEKQAADEERSLHRKHIEALIKSMEKPPPPEKPVPEPKPTKAQEAEATLGRPLTDTEKQIIAGVYREPKVAKPGKAAVPGTAQKPSTAGERRSSGALGRAVGLDQLATSLESNFTIKDQFRLKTPYIIQTNSEKQYTRARKAFTETVLREFSGAAISKDEYNKYDEIFFAQPGDTPDVTQQKQQSRKDVMEQLRKMAGSAAPPPGLRALDAILGIKAFDAKAARTKYGY